MKDLVGYIAAALVDNPEQVAIEEVVGNQASVLELKVAKEDCRVKAREKAASARLSGLCIEKVKKRFYEKSE